MKEEVLVFWDFDDVEFPVGKVLKTFEVAPLKDEVGDLFELLKLLFDINSDFTDVDLAEIEFLSICLKILQTVFDVLQCAHLDIITISNTLNIDSLL